MLSDRVCLELTLSELQPNWTNSNTTHNLYDEDTDTNKQKTKTLFSSNQIGPIPTPHTTYTYIVDEDTDILYIIYPISYMTRPGRRYPL